MAYSAGVSRVGSGAKNTKVAINNIRNAWNDLKIDEMANESAAISAY